MRKLYSIDTKILSAYYNCIYFLLFSIHFSIFSYSSFKETLGFNHCGMVFLRQSKKISLNLPSAFFKDSPWLKINTYRKYFSAGFFILDFLLWLVSSPSGSLSWMIWIKIGKRCLYPQRQMFSKFLDKLNT